MAATREADPEQRHQQARAAGLQPETLDAWIASQQPQEDTPEPEAADPAWWAPDGEPFPVWRENWPAVRVWMLVQRTWRVTPRGHLHGLRWGEVESVARMLRLKDRDTLLQHLDEMQAAAVAADRA